MTTLVYDAHAVAVVAAAAPLWDSVEAAEEVAVLGGTSYAQYQAWARALIADQEPLTGRLHTVALCGEPVRVLGEAGASFVTVELMAQPNGASGYVGVMSAAHIGRDARGAVTHVVARCGVQGAAVRIPDGAAHEQRPSAAASSVEQTARRIELAAGATVELLSREHEDFARVLLASGAVVRVPHEALRPVRSTLTAAEVLRLATRFIGTPYLWSGMEAVGIDCSGLVHTAARMGGRVIPRDAHHQWAATRFDADWADLDAGDLVFFGSSASLDGIDHVGLYVEDGRMLHAPEAGRAVAVEAISARTRTRAVGFGRL